MRLARWRVWLAGTTATHTSPCFHHMLTCGRRPCTRCWTPASSASSSQHSMRCVEHPLRQHVIICLELHLPATCSEAIHPSNCTCGMCRTRQCTLKLCKWQPSSRCPRQHSHRRCLPWMQRTLSRPWQPPPQVLASLVICQSSDDRCAFPVPPGVGCHTYQYHHLTQRHPARGTGRAARSSWTWFPHTAWPSSPCRTSPRLSWWWVSGFAPQPHLHHQGVERWPMACVPEHLV